MPLNTFQIKPGFDKQNSEVGAVARWVSGDNIRFRYGLSEKVGGWSALGSTTLSGVSRKLFPFRDNDGNKYLAIGMDKFLLIYFEDNFYDITPYRTSGYPATIDEFSLSTFTTVSGSNSVTITTTSTNRLSVGDIVEFEDVNLPVGPSGSCSIFPLETIGNQIQELSFGWSTGVWGGSNNWGKAATTNGVNTPPAIWSLSSFGQVLVSTILNGKTFTWNPAAGNPLGTRASIDTTGFETTSNPTQSRLTLVSPTTRHLIHLGTETTVGTPSTQDNMFVRFSSQEQINNYLITASNSAGSQRIQDGTKIMGAIKSKEAILIWTDNALYIMRHIGAPFVFGFEQVGTNCGLIGQNAVVEVDGVAYWMSDKGFFAYDGSVKTLDCMVEDYVYDDIDLTQGQQIHAGVNNLYTEVRWDYPSSSVDYNNRYVVLNFAESKSVPGGVWYTGNTSRTSWSDANVFNKPFGTSFDPTTNGAFPAVIGETGAPNGYGNSTLFQHEVGTDQVNADASVTNILSNIESFDFDITNITGNVKVTLNLKDYPSESASASTYSPFTVTSSTKKVDTRARGRFLSIKIENNGAGQSWRYGTLRIDVQPDGRR